MVRERNQGLRVSLRCFTTNHNCSVRLVRLLTDYVVKFNVLLDVESGSGQALGLRMAFQARLAGFPSFAGRSHRATAETRLASRCPRLSKANASNGIILGGVLRGI